MEFEENKEKFEGNRTRNLKEKHREFFTRVKKIFIYSHSKINFLRTFFLLEQIEILLEHFHKKIYSTFDPKSSNSFPKINPSILK